jgi:polar amino acid transport system substrate-binding protein
MEHISLLGRHLALATAASLGCLALAVAGCSSSGGGSGSSAGQTTNSSGAGPNASSSLHSLLPASIRSAGKLVVGTNAPYPPYEDFQSAGSTVLVGLDIDLGTAIAKQLGVSADFVQQPYDGLIPGLQAGKYDMLMAAISTDQSRRATVTFVDYARSGPALLVKSGNPLGIKTFLDLCGKPVAVEAGDDQATELPARSSQCVSAGKRPINVVILPQFTDGVLALESGKVDAVASAISTVVSSLKQPGGAHFTAVENPAILGNAKADEHNLGIAILKSNTSLVPLVQKALQQLMDNGTYQRLMAKYGLSDWEVPSATINGPVVAGTPRAS